jgi:hypothetical protein
MIPVQYIYGCDCYSVSALLKYICTKLKYDPAHEIYLTDDGHFAFVFADDFIHVNNSNIVF